MSDVSFSMEDNGWMTFKKKEELRPEDNPSTGGVKFDNGKTAYELIPVEGPAAVAQVLAYGAKKYAPRNWEQGMAWSRPYAAIHRHLAAWWSGGNA
jgi:hypothetical protein